MEKNVWDKWRKVVSSPPYIGVPFDGKFLYIVVGDTLYKIKV